MTETPTSTPADPVVVTCAVIGTGLIGGSVALAAAESGVQVQAWDRDEAASAAVARRAGTSPRARGGITVAASAADAVATAELVVLAIPVEAIPTILAEIQPRMKSHAVVTDVGSIKVNLQARIEALPPGANGTWTTENFVGGHPMAGRAQGGSSAVDGRLFHGATWILAPTEHTSTTAFALVRRFVASLGAHVLAVSPQVHDRLVGVVSHLPQLLATELMVLAEQQADDDAEVALAMAAGGFRDATRVAASDPDLWVGILRANRQSVLAALDGYAARLAGLRGDLEAENWPAVRARLEAGRAARDRLPTKQRATDVVDVMVPIDDRPGMVAQVATALGEAAVNIEDLHLQHADEVAAGAIVVTVEASAADRALAALERRGLVARRAPRQG
ncbi:MAG TPA: prephenate dehydrogenase/arogenate dehydrogenase family protein [Nitriliruptorales bacterium]